MPGVFESIQHPLGAGVRKKLQEKFGPIAYEILYMLNIGISQIAVFDAEIDFQRVCYLLKKLGELKRGGKLKTLVFSGEFLEQQIGGDYVLVHALIRFEEAGEITEHFREIFRVEVVRLKIIPEIGHSGKKSLFGLELDIYLFLEG
jgi:hypothetical protein